MALFGKYTNARILAGAYDLSGLSNNAAINYTAAMLDVTTMGMATKANLAGIKDMQLTASGHMSLPAAADLTDATLFNAVGSATDIPVTLMPGPLRAEGERAYFFKAASAQFQVGGAHGAIAPFTLQANAGQLGYPLSCGYVLEGGETARTVTGAGTGFVAGAVGATQYVYACLHVFSAVTGGGETLDVIIQSDADGAFPAGSTTRFTFTQATGITSQYMTRVAGAIADTYWRASWTIAGAAPSFKFAVVVGII